MRRRLTSTALLIALVATAGSGIAWASSRSSSNSSSSRGHVAAAPHQVWLSYGGNPKHTGYTLLKRYTVPAGFCLKVVHTNALAEKHSPPQAQVDAGEFTVMVGGIAQSSLETNNGIAYQGQGARNITLLPGQPIDIGIWLRPGKNPELYYYAVSMIGNRYRCHR